MSAKPSTGRKSAQLQNLKPHATHAYSRMLRGRIKEVRKGTRRGQGGSGGHGHKSSVQSKLDPDEELMVGELPIEMVDGGDKRP